MEYVIETILGSIFGVFLGSYFIYIVYKWVKEKFIKKPEK